MMMGKTPAWYMTTQQFADEVVNLLEEIGYFKKDEMCHPEDIVSAFNSVAESFAKGVGVAGKRVRDAEGVIAK
jgi:hypothetical protein